MFRDQPLSLVRGVLVCCFSLLKLGVKESRVQTTETAAQPSCTFAAESSIFSAFSSLSGSTRPPWATSVVPASYPTWDGAQWITPVQGDESNHSPVFTLPLNDLIGLPTERKIPEKMKILLDQFRIKKDCISHGEVRAESVETFVEWDVLCRLPVSDWNHLSCCEFAAQT